MTAPLEEDVPLAAGYTPELEEILVDAIDAAIFELHTGLPAKVVRYDKAKQTADVQPLIQRVYLDPETDAPKLFTLPQVTNAPVHFMAGGGWVIHFPLAPGDLVYLSFAERSLDRWLESAPGTQVDPKDARKHSLSDAIVVPGIRTGKNPIANLHAENLILGREDGSVKLELTPTGTVNVIAATAVNLGGEGGPAVGRVGDAVVIDGEAFLAWVEQVAAVAGPGPSGSPIPFTGTITGKIAAGSPKVRST